MTIYAHTELSFDNVAVLPHAHSRLSDKRMVATDDDMVRRQARVLAVLRAHGIVNDRREGNVVYYTLLTPCVMRFFLCATQVLKGRA